MFSKEPGVSCTQCLVFDCNWELEVQKCLIISTKDTILPQANMSGKLLG